MEYQTYRIRRERIYIRSILSLRWNGERETECTEYFNDEMSREREREFNCEALYHIPRGGIQTEMYRGENKKLRCLERDRQ